MIPIKYRLLLKFDTLKARVKETKSEYDSIKTYYKNIAHTNAVINTFIVVANFMSSNKEIKANTDVNKKDRFKILQRLYKVLTSTKKLSETDKLLYYVNKKFDLGLSLCHYIIKEYSPTDSPLPYTNKPYKSELVFYMHDGNERRFGASDLYTTAGLNALLNAIKEHPTEVGKDKIYNYDYFIKNY